MWDADVPDLVLVSSALYDPICADGSLADVDGLNFCFCEDSGSSSVSQALVYFEERTLFLVIEPELVDHSNWV